MRRDARSLICLLLSTLWACDDGPVAVELGGDAVETRYTSSAPNYALASTSGETLFGPVTVVRRRGRPRIRRFAVDVHGFDAPFTLELTNGDGRHHRTRSVGWVWLDDHLIWGPRALNRRSEALSADVDIQGSAVLRVKLIGRPRSFVTLSVTGAVRVPPILFESDRNGDIELYAINPDATGLVQLTDTPGANRQPTWSPDGTKIVFYSDRTGDREIWVMDADGGNQTQLTSIPGRDVSPNWSPDGEFIVWDRDFDIYRMRADGSDVTVLNATTDQEGAPSYSPDGRLIAFGRQRPGVFNRMVLMNADGSNERNLTIDPVRVNSTGFWTADGTYIYTAAAPRGGLAMDIARIDVATRAIEYLTSDRGQDTNPVLSPDETELMFNSNRLGLTQVFLMDLSAPNPPFFQLTTEPGFSGANSWRR